jgi:hypothetical protein
LNTYPTFLSVCPTLSLFAGGSSGIGFRDSGATSLQTSILGDLFPISGNRMILHMSASRRDLDIAMGRVPLQ